MLGAAVATHHHGLGAGPGAHGQAAASPSPVSLKATPALAMMCLPKATAHASPRLVEGEPMPAITALMPWLASAPPHPVAASVIARLPRGQEILRTSIRLIRFPDDVNVIVYVESLPACNEQALFVGELTKHGLGGGAATVTPDSPPLTDGGYSYGSFGPYVVTVRKGATRISATNQPGPHRTPVSLHRTVKLGVVAFKLPRHTGPVRMTEYAADDHPVATLTLRR
jgi:hypothetical protein